MTVSSKSGRQTMRALAVLASAGAIGLALAGCTPDEPTTTEKGTTPAVITGNPAPTAGLDVADGIGESGHGETAAATLKTTSGKEIGEATFSPTGESLAVVVKINSGSGLAEGLHGMHIHTGTTCNPADDFASAGGHLQVDGHTGTPESGDLVSMSILADGSGATTTSTSSVTLAQVTGHTLIIHDAAPDTEARVACGVIEAEDN
ncbi:superoxide dismutase family protein [Gordonia sp. NB41Y]|uniref:superoxide dismutase family protein n=1 Tax=Gordonia sp. NB41Y TaxID=875808 RepID=UPI0002BED0F4|nr:superoxide dismutase family protein [Gordonia sp. NB41Y]EMP10787.1 superoxide dismutase [Gordonia sp. NB41Y]WLP92361.1 superoxide dismutase family protein [Gordonia sp. NB41Y]